MATKAMNFKMDEAEILDISAGERKHICKIKKLTKGNRF